VVEVAARPGKPLTRKAAAESPASTSKMAPAKAATHMGAAESATHMGAAESAAHMSATTEAAGVSTPAATTVSAPTSPAVRSKRVSGQSSGESGSRSQNDHRLT
jgi:hypothetical protein